MKRIQKLLIYADLAWEFIVPYLCCLYLVYHNAAYWYQIIIFGWIACLVHFSITGIVFIHQLQTPRTNYLFSFLATLTFIVLLVLGYMDLAGYLINGLMAELVATILAFIFSLIFHRNAARQSASQEIGLGIVILNILLYVVAIYPFIQEWINFQITSQAAIIYWVQAGVVLTFATYKKAEGIAQVVKQRDLATSKTETTEEEPSPDQKEKKSSSKAFISSEGLILLGLLLWFVVLGVLAAIN